MISQASRDEIASGVGTVGSHGQAADYIDRVTLRLLYEALDVYRGGSWAWIPGAGAPAGEGTVNRKAQAARTWQEQLRQDPAGQMTTADHAYLLRITLDAAVERGAVLEADAEYLGYAYDVPRDIGQNIVDLPGDVAKGAVDLAGAAARAAGTATTYLVIAAVAVVVILLALRSRG